MATPTPLPRRVYKISSTLKAEDAEQYKPGGLHPILLGDSFKDGRYRIVHKLGFGSFSTVWLARDTLRERYVSLKMTRADFNPDSNELRILRYLAGRNNKHHGSEYVMRLEDYFVIKGPNGDHHCIVTQVAGRRLARPAGVNYSCLGPARLLACQLFQAVDYLHTCNVGHGGKLCPGVKSKPTVSHISPDIYTGNILLQLDSFDSWSPEQIYACLGHPVCETLHRIDGTPVEECAPKYTVHPGDLSGLEARMLLSKVLIIDFGQAFFLDEPPRRTTTPSQFSAPENILALGASRASDVWALGCNVFEICAGYTLFKALFLPRQDVLRDMVAMLGKLPERFWSAWKERNQYFDDEDQVLPATETSIPFQSYSLFGRVRDLAWLYPADGHVPDCSAREKVEYLQTMELVQLHDLLSKIFRMEPDSRITVEDALAHPFLTQMNLSKLGS